MVVSTDARRNVNLYPEAQNRAPKDLRNRFQWIAPIVMDPLDPSTVYHASQYVNRTRDSGMTWETVEGSKGSMTMGAIHWNRFRRSFGARF